MRVTRFKSRDKEEKNKLDRQIILNVTSESRDESQNSNKKNFHRLSHNILYIKLRIARSKNPLP